MVRRTVRTILVSVLHGVDLGGESREEVREGVGWFILGSGNHPAFRSPEKLGEMKGLKEIDGPFEPGRSYFIPFRD